MLASKRGRERTACRPILVRLHRDEQGGMLDYAAVFAFVAAMLILPVWPVRGEMRSVFGMLFEVLSDYFGMMAFFVSWPFI